MEKKRGWKRKRYTIKGDEESKWLRKKGREEKGRGRKICKRKRGNEKKGRGKYEKKERC